MDDNKSPPIQKPWLFGPQWQGRRCGAKTRTGTLCQKPALKHNARCQIHGGRGGAPAGELNGNYRHGSFTKATLEKRTSAKRRLVELLHLGRSVGMFR